MHYHDYNIQEKQAHDELKLLWPIYIELVERKLPSIWAEIVSADKKQTRGMPNWQKLEYFKLQNRINASIPDPLWHRVKGFFKCLTTRPA